MSERQLRTRERHARAQSEILGYVIILSIIVATMTVTVFVGLGALEEVRSASVTENSEAAMQSVAADMEAIARGTAQTRTSELTLRSGSLEIGPVTMFNVTAKLGGRKVTLNRSFRPLVFSIDGTKIVYENTLLVRDQKRGAVALTDPLLTASTSHTVISVLETTPSTIESLGGGTRQIKIRAAGTDGVSLARPTGSIEVNVTVQTVPDRADVWERVLNDALPSPAGSEPCHRMRPSAVGCDFTTKRVTMSSVNATYEYE